VSRLALANPKTWWPIEQDYCIDDYQFRCAGPLPPRVDLKTGHVRMADCGRRRDIRGTVPGGAATVMDFALFADKPMRQLTLRTIANDVVVGLLSVTLLRPQGG
jgi:hypothetical protein